MIIRIAPGAPYIYSFFWSSILLLFTLQLFFFLSLSLAALSICPVLHTFSSSKSIPFQKLNTNSIYNPLFLSTQIIEFHPKFRSSLPEFREFRITLYREEMIQLFFSLIFAEMALVILLLFKTPLRKLVIMGMDRVKRGRGPVVVKTVAGTFLVVFASSVYSMMKIQKRTADGAATVNPTDQVLFSKHLLEASLMGFSLFLAWMTDRLHHYIRELRLLRKSMEAVKKQSRVSEDGKTGGSEAVKTMEGEINSLKLMVKQMESECETKTKEAKAAENNAVALRKQSEGFLLEYDRLLEDNQNLRSQLQSIDQGTSHSDGKKNT